MLHIFKTITMKVSIQILGLSALLGLGLPSCKKHEIAKAEITSDKGSFKDIKAPAAFKWSTLNTVTIQMKAKPNDARSSTLKVLDAQGNVYLQKLQKANQAFEGVVEIPGHIEKLKVSFCGKIKEFSARSGKVILD